ncbi:MAG TPA: NAD(P)-dependent oxidoreductase [Usitatibacter sp.]|jgi:3-hydroxyisobutyrate dehydrogenase-like beta-hydroxyacid dehydrogenase|nr:NAD(P)-dependent oxidoreductase [Usitatibacter sp.]
MSNARVGFIGLGLMGHGMAKNLAAKGFPLTVKVNRDRSRLADIVALGAREATTNAGAGRDADVVVLCVNGSPQVEDVVYGEAGLLESARKGLVVVDTSTSEPGSTRRVRDAFAARGTAFIDAPLARTPKEAEEGRLNAMVGADAADLERIRPVLAAFCENIFHVGPPGAGHTLKLVNNFMALTIAASIAEAFAVASRAGVELDQLVEVVSQGALNSGLFQMIGRGAVQGDLTRMKFSIANAAKDMRYYTHLAESLPVASFIGEAVHQSFEQAVAMGLGDRLVASLLEAQERLNGIAIVPR